MVALGVDVSTRELALVALWADGTLNTHAVMLDAALRGARRLSAARSAAYAVLRGYSPDAGCVLIELPWRGELNRVATVVAEAAQSALPSAVVMEAGPSVWRKELFGRGSAGKPEAFQHAAGMGYVGMDDNLAEAACIAQCAMERLLAVTGDLAA